MYRDVKGSELQCGNAAEEEEEEEVITVGMLMVHLVICIGDEVDIVYRPILKYRLILRTMKR